MDIEQICEFCLSLPETTECFPFDETTLVFKVAGKCFFIRVSKPNNIGQM